MEDQLKDPPKYTPPRRLCQFCNTTHPEEEYDKHVVVTHSSIIFYCEECSQYVLRKQLISHMSLHADEYTKRFIDVKFHEKFKNMGKFDIKQNNEANSKVTTHNTSSMSMAQKIANLASLILHSPNFNSDAPVTGNQNRTVTRSQTNNSTAGITRNLNTNISAPKTDSANATTSAPVTHNANINPTVPVQANQNKNIVSSLTCNQNTNTTDPLVQNQIATAPLTQNLNTKATVPDRPSNALKTPTLNSDDTVLSPRDQNTSATAPISYNINKNATVLLTRYKNINSAVQNTKTGPITRRQNASKTAKVATTAVAQSTKISKNNQENEFSDQSDMEFGFGPLPESVFEAIEDTQENQDDTNTSQAVETDNLSEENPPKEKTSKQQRKTRTCPICGKVYKASSSYFYHLKHTHKRVKEHECDICARKFATKGSLTSHMTTHTGECKFECKHCNKRFRSKASLFIHEQTHNGNKTRSCDQCSSSFRWKTHLLRHIKRKHTSEKAHACSTCGRRFNIRCDMLRHARTHTAGDYSCEKCNVKFAQLRYLKAHMEKKHSSKAWRKS